MSIAKLNEEEKNLLLQLSYIDINDVYNDGEEINLGKLINKIKIQAGYAEDKRVQNISNYIEKNKGNNNLENLTLIDYSNDNFGKVNNTSSKDPSGLVGYAFKDSDGNGTTIFRGSESGDLNNGWLDWGSNALATTGIEIRQQKLALEFHQKNMKDIKGETLILGHSKGGNLATYVFLNSLGPNIFAEVLNGQPIYWFGLSDEEKQALRGDNYTFISTSGDIVSLLGMPFGVIDKCIKMEGFSLNPFAPHFEYNTKIENGSYVNDNAFSMVLNPVTALEIAVGGLANIIVWGINGAVFVADKIYKAGVSLINGLKDVAIKIIESAKQEVAKFAKNVSSLFEKINNYFDNLSKTIASLVTGKGSKNSDSYVIGRISVDTARLASYESQLRQIRTRIANINDRIDNLYFKVGLFGIDNIFRVDILTSGTSKMNSIITSLQKTRSILEENERKLKLKAQQI